MNKQDRAMLKLVSWIKRGRQRKLVLEELPYNHPAFPEELRKETNAKIKTGTKLSLREVSRQLTDFKEKGIVVCFDEELPWGRSYLLTNWGLKLKQLYTKFEAEKKK